MGRPLNPDIQKYLPDIKTGKVGESLAIVAHPFADPINNNQLLDIAFASGLPKSNPDDVKRAQETISGPGFKTRHLSHRPDEDLDTNEGLRRQGVIGATLIKRSMEAMDWDGIDAYIDTSAFLPLSINEQILEEAGLLGQDIIKKSYRNACAGVLPALFWALTNPDFEGRSVRVVIGANEPLSWLMTEKHLNTPEHLHIPSLFSDGNAAIALDTSHIHLSDKRVLVKPDNGVIRLKPMYEFETAPHDSTTVPDYYHFDPGGEQILHHSNSGGVLDYQKPDDEDLAVTINGMATLRFFGKVAADEITTTYNKNADRQSLSPDRINFVIHPASEPVLGLSSKRLQTSGIFKPGDQLQFRMGEAGLANSSSATLPNYWLDMILNNAYYPNLPTLWMAPGIGSITATALGYVDS